MRGKYTETNRVKMFPVGSEQLDNDVELQAEFREWLKKFSLLWGAFILALLIGAAMIPVIFGK